MCEPALADAGGEGSGDSAAMVDDRPPLLGVPPAAVEPADAVHAASREARPARRTRGPDKRPRAKRSRLEGTSESSETGDAAQLGPPAESKGDTEADRSVPVLPTPSALVASPAAEKPKPPAPGPRSSLSSLRRLSSAAASGQAEQTGLLAIVDNAAKSPVETAATPSPSQRHASILAQIVSARRPFFQQHLIEIAPAPVASPAGNTGKQVSGGDDGPTGEGPVSEASVRSEAASTPSRKGLLPSLLVGIAPPASATPAPECSARQADVSLARRPPSLIPVLARARPVESPQKGPGMGAEPQSYAAQAAYFMRSPVPVASLKRFLPPVPSFHGMRGAAVGQGASIVNGQGLPFAAPIPRRPSMVPKSLRQTPA